MTEARKEKRNQIILGIGAEAIVTKTNKTTVRKSRPEKKYRLTQIDLRLRKTRTRSEAKILQRLHENDICAPQLKKVNDAGGKMFIDMEFVGGKILRDVLTEKNVNVRQISTQLGTTLAQMHNLDIIHSDLTTSNMIVRDAKNGNKKNAARKQTNEIVLIDFGLSYFSKRAEDKAVDLHLLRQALESYHYSIAAHAFKQILATYKKKCNDKDVIARLSIVERRGRNKQQ